MVNVLPFCVRSRCQGNNYAPVNLKVFLDAQAVRLEKRLSCLAFKGATDASRIRAWSPMNIGAFPSTGNWEHWYLLQERGKAHLPIGVRPGPADGLEPAGVRQTKQQGRSPNGETEMGQERRQSRSARFRTRSSPLPRQTCFLFAALQSNQTLSPPKRSF